MSTGLFIIIFFRITEAIQCTLLKRNLNAASKIRFSFIT
jgi:hypothetical protein